MITLDDIQHGWASLVGDERGEAIPAQSLALVVLPAGSPLLTDYLQQRHLLIPLAAPHAIAPDQASIGIHLLVNMWGLDGTMRHYVDLVCRLPHLNDLFDLVIYDVCTALASDPTDPVAVCRHVLAAWRELLAVAPASTPDMTTLIGAFGELWMLRFLTDQHPRAIELWGGPMGARHDFSNGQHALEVKTSLQHRGRTVTIHGHDQLAVPPNGSLTLAVIALESTPQGGLSLDDLVQSLLARRVASDQLWRRLAALQLTATLLTQLREHQWVVRQYWMYAVDSDFPRIVAASFVDGALPRGVIGLSYQIDLAVPPPLPLDDVTMQTVFATITQGFRHGT